MVIRAFFGLEFDHKILTPTRVKVMNEIIKSLEKMLKSIKEDGEILSKISSTIEVEQNSCFFLFAKIFSRFSIPNLEKVDMEMVSKIVQY